MFHFERREELNRKPIVVSVVGHTNHGKTSLVRTLAFDAAFGDVSDEPGVTQEVEGKRFQENGKTMMLLFDTPGFELADQALAHCGHDCRIEDVVEYFRGDSNLENESKVLDQILESHVILYIVDVSQKPKKKYQDEFRVLYRSKRPVVPVMNFLYTEPNFRHEWEDFFERSGCFVHTPFDAFIRCPEDEERLYHRIRDLLHEPLYVQFLNTWIEVRQRNYNDNFHRTMKTIAGLLLDVAAYCARRSNVTRKTKREAAEDLRKEFQQEIEDREATAQATIAELFGYSQYDIENRGVVSEGKEVWKQNLFDHTRLFWTSVTAGGSSGAVTGGVIDASVGGASFLLGSLILGAAGAVAGGVFARFYEANWSEPEGLLKLRASDATLELLLRRALALADDLRRRGHAKNDLERVDTRPPKIRRQDREAVRKIWEQTRRAFELPAPRVAENQKKRRGFVQLFASMLEAVEDITHALRSKDAQPDDSAAEETEEHADGAAGDG